MSGPSSNETADPKGKAMPHRNRVGQAKMSLLGRYIRGKADRSADLCPMHMPKPRLTFVVCVGLVKFVPLRPEIDGESQRDDR